MPAPLAEDRAEHRLDAMRLRWVGEGVTVPSSAYAPLDWLVRGGPCAVADLVTLAPTIEPTDVRELLTQLADEGLVIALDAWPPAAAETPGASATPHAPSLGVWTSIPASL